MKLCILFSIFLSCCTNKNLNNKACIAMFIPNEDKQVIPAMFFCEDSAIEIHAPTDKIFILNKKIVDQIKECAFENSDTSTTSEDAYLILMLFNGHAVAHNYVNKKYQLINLFNCLMKILSDNKLTDITEQIEKVRNQVIQYY